MAYDLSACILSLQVLATTCEELPPDGILLLYLSASGCIYSYDFFSILQCSYIFLLYLSTPNLRSSCSYGILQTFSGRAGNAISSPSSAGTYTDVSESNVRGSRSHRACHSSTSLSRISSQFDTPDSLTKGDCAGHATGCLQFGNH